MRAEVKRRTHGRCHLCLWRAGFLVGTAPPGRGERLWPRGEIPGGRHVARIAHIHHVFSVQRWPELATDPANLIGLCVVCHADHHAVAGHGDPRRIPREALPAMTVALAAGHGPRTNELLRTYPHAAAGRPPAHDGRA